MKEPLAVVAGLIEREGRVLIGRRRPGGQHPLKWEFPGGKVEPGEDPRAALARELKEELAIEAEIGEELLRYDYSYPGGRRIVLIFFRVPAFRGELANLDFAELRWEPRERLAAYDFLDGDRRFLSQMRP